jgi:hypothetical protein
VLGGAVALVLANIYYDGALLKKALAHKKYYKMAGIALAAIALYMMLKHSPARARALIASSGEYIKYMPLDRSSTSILAPVLDFTAGGAWGGSGVTGDHPIVEPARPGFAKPSPYTGGGIARELRVKRSVSETKKKFVAARQQWFCGHCKNLLNHTFEIDHIVSLNNGGSNHVDNLVALCPACHREKTAQENMDSQI